MTEPTLPVKRASGKPTKKKPKSIDDAPDPIQRRLSVNPSDERNGLHIRCLRIEDRLDRLRLDWVEAKKAGRDGLLSEIETTAAELTAERDELLAEIKYRSVNPMFNPDPPDPVASRAWVILWRLRIRQFLRDNRKTTPANTREFLKAYGESLADYQITLEELVANRPEVSDVETTE